MLNIKFNFCSNKRKTKYENIPAKNIQRTSVFIGTIGINLTIAPVFAQDADESEKIQLMSEALYARDAGDLLLAKEKADMLLSLAPNDRNVQVLLLSINENIEKQGLMISDNSYVESAQISKQVESEDIGSVKVENREFNSAYEENKALVSSLIDDINSKISSGDLAGATSTLYELEARDPNNKEAKLLSLKLSKAIDKVQGLNLYKTRENMLNSVDNSWDQPKVFELEKESLIEEVSAPTLLRKLERIILPKINFSGMELTLVIENLSELSFEYDPKREGVNIVPLFNPSEFNPKVNITLRNLSLDKILQFVTQQVNFTFIVGTDAVTIQPSDSIGGSSSTVTEFFPITRATVIRLTGFRETSGGSVSDDPFAEDVEIGFSQDQEKQALQKFLQNAGVNFDGVPGSSLAFDGEQLIVTQTPRNIDRLRTILRNYTEVKQVEIETKFLEVSQNDLDELGFHWGLGSNFAGEDWTIASNLRSLSDIGGSDSSNRARIISGESAPGVSNTEESFKDDPVKINPPDVGGTLSFGTARPFFSDKTTRDSSGSAITTGFIKDHLNIDLEIKALARKTGSDLMSAPKVTVLSGKRANIVVAQELRYPQSYGDIESTVSSGGSGGSSSVAITAGTPQDFTTRNVGVEMAVTPNVRK